MPKVLDTAAGDFTFSREYVVTGNKISLVLFQYVSKLEHYLGLKAETYIRFVPLLNYIRSALE